MALLRHWYCWKKFKVVEGSVKPLLATHGLQSFEDFMWGEFGRVVTSSHNMQVRQMGSFYLKRTLREPFSKILLLLLRGIWPHVTSVREKQLVELLRVRGFSVMPVIAWGEKRIFGIPREGFVLVEEAPGLSLEAVFCKAECAHRLKIFKALGTLLGRLHSYGFFQVVRLKDLIVKDENFNLTLIDREATSPWPKSFSLNKCASALARCYCKFKRSGFSLNHAKEWLAFLRAYRAELAHAWPSQFSFTSRVKKYAENILSTRKYR